MGRFLTSDDFIAQFGEREVRQIAGSGEFNSLEGSAIDFDAIEEEIDFAEELIAGYVLARHPWLADQGVTDIPKLLKGLGGDIVRYRLRDKPSSRGETSQRVEDRYKEALKRLEDIQAGKLDVPRDQNRGVELATPELPGAHDDTARISGPASQADTILEGW